MNKILHLSDETFESDVIESSLNATVIVDFGAKWCQPCLMFAPIFADVSKNCKENIKFTFADIDKNQKYASEYNVRSIPTVLIFKNKNVVATHSGAMTKTQLIAFITNN